MELFTKPFQGHRAEELKFFSDPSEDYLLYHYCGHAHTLQEVRECCKKVFACFGCGQEGAILTKEKTTTHEDMLKVTYNSHESWIDRPRINDENLSMLSTPEEMLNIISHNCCVYYANKLGIYNHVYYESRRNDKSGIYPISSMRLLSYKFQKVLINFVKTSKTIREKYHG